jgi:putative endonuclease
VSRTDDWFVYIAICGDGSLYTGVARDVAARLHAHSSGRGARYTRGRAPVKLGAKLRCPSKNEALRLEMAIKRLARTDKQRLISAAGRLRAFARAWRARQPSER